MKLYQTPSGTWAGSEKDWNAAMKAEGSDPKAATRKIVEVPIDKKGLMEFLTFNNVNVVNPQAAPAPEVTGGGVPPTPPLAVGDTPTTMPNLDEMFTAAPTPKQVELAVALLDRLEVAVR